jgi:hypothetical protein
MASSPLSPSPAPEKAWRRRLAFPTLLAPALDVRIEEVKRDTFSQHAIETVCFDLRIRRAHAVTGQFARDTPRVQDASDRFIIAHYRPGAERDGGTLRKLSFNTLPPMTRRQQLPRMPDPKGRAGGREQPTKPGISRIEVSLSAKLRD